MGLESYAPEMIEVWKKAATKPVYIKLDSHNACVRLRQKLYRLRRELQKNQHEAAASANRAVIRILIDADNNHIVAIEPEGLEFEKAIAEAGIVVPKEPDIEI